MSPSPSTIAQYSSECVKPLCPGVNLCHLFGKYLPSSDDSVSASGRRPPNAPIAVMMIRVVKGASRYVPARNPPAAPNIAWFDPYNVLHLLLIVSAIGSSQ